MVYAVADAGSACASKAAENAPVAGLIVAVVEDPLIVIDTLPVGIMPPAAIVPETVVVAVPYTKLAEAAKPPNAGVTLGVAALAVFDGADAPAPFVARTW